MDTGQDRHPWDGQPSPVVEPDVAARDPLVEDALSPETRRRLAALDPKPCASVPCPHDEPLAPLPAADEPFTPTSCV